VPFFKPEILPLMLTMPILLALVSALICRPAAADKSVNRM